MKAPRGTKLSKQTFSPVSECCPTGESSPRNPSSPAGTVSQIVLEAEGLSFRYGNEVDAVDGVNFRIMAGEAVALCGHNGSGKTTLIKLLAGLLKPAQGHVRLSGVELDSRSSRQAFRTVGLLFQDPQDQLFCNEVREDIAYGPRNMGFSDVEVNDKVRLALTITEMEHLEHRPIHHLSGGEMKRVALAGLVAMSTPVLILDEPFNGLDPASTTRLVALIRHLTREHGYTMLMTTHQMSLVPEVADRMLIMQRGRLIADGPVHNLLTDVPLLKQARLKPPTITSFFYEKAVREGCVPERLPLTLDEALKWHGNQEF